MFPEDIMQTRMLTIAIASSIAVGAFALMPPVQAATTMAGATNASTSLPAAASTAMQDDDDDNEAMPNDQIECQMDFRLSGWSVFYKSASGNGTITCSNGQTMDVVINVTGGGLTFGHYQINDGHGEFTDLTDITQALGHYAMATAHAGAVKSTRAAAMTNGDASLVITGTGNGWNIGAGFASFTIKRASDAGTNHSVDTGDNY